MGHPDHVAACEVLPEEFLRKLSEFLGGRAAYLWVPSRESLNRQKRDKYILALSEQGCSTEEIAVRLCISSRQVRRVLARKKARSLPSRAPAKS